MFTQVEENYIKSLINTYKKEGYNYYICHTVTENDNNYDVYIYFSKEEIKAVSNNTFDLTNAIYIQLDSSNRNDNSYNSSTHSRIRIVNSKVNSIVEINQAEFIYTNAIHSYKTETTVLNPNLMLQGSNSYFSICFMIVSLIVLLITFLYTFISNIFRLRK